MNVHSNSCAVNVAMRTKAGDRAAQIQRALLELVAERGFHGASMNAVARRAGVATGAAYTYFESKEALVLATYLAAKAELSRAALAGVDASTPPGARFEAIWRNIYDHLASDPAVARFLVQVDCSPFAAAAHAAAEAEQSELAAAATAADVRSLLIDVPERMLYELALAPAVRLAASAEALPKAVIAAAAHGCWRAITRESPADSQSGFHSTDKAHQ